MYKQITSKEAYEMLRKNETVHATTLKWKPDWHVEYAPEGSENSISSMVNMVKQWIIANSDESTGKSIIYWKWLENKPAWFDDDLPY